MKKLGILLLAAAFAVCGLMTFAACNEETLGPGDDPIVTPGPDDPDDPGKPDEPTPPDEPEATEGLVFELITTENVDDFGFVVISGALGEDFEDCYMCTGLTVAEENVVIPSTYNGLPVRVVFWYGWENEDIENSIISLYIPDSVQYIRFRGIDYASYGNLTNIRLPRNPNAMIYGDTFSNCAFYNDPNNWEDGALYMDGWLLATNADLPEEYTVKQGTYGIATCAFIDPDFYGRHVKKVTVPDGVQALVGSFENCIFLEEVVLPDTLSSIGDWAFNGCRSLTSITIPDGVTYIDNRAFSYCSSLTSITIPDGVTFIGDYAFCGCDSLTSIAIPDSVTFIGDEAFYGCDSLTSIAIPDSVTFIGDWAFFDCGGLTSITIPDSITSIGEGAFRYCDSLTTVYYRGSEAEWNEIEIGSNNYYLTDSEIVFNYKGE